MSSFVNDVFNAYSSQFKLIFGSDNKTLILCILVLFAIILFFNFIFRERRG